MNFKYLSQEFSGVYPYEYMNNSERFFDFKLTDKFAFYSSLKDNALVKKIICMLLMF